MVMSMPQKWGNATSRQNVGMQVGWVAMLGRCVG